MSHQQDVKSKIAAALRRLSELPPSPNTWDLATDDYTLMISEDYLGFIAPVWTKAGNPARSIGIQATRLLSSLQKYPGSDLTSAFHAMPMDHPFELHQTDRDRLSLGMFEVWLERLVKAAAQTEDKTRPRGRKAASRSHAVASLAAEHYHHLSGRTPSLTKDKVDGTTKVSGYFFDLLKDIFDALGIKSNVENCAKTAIGRVSKGNP